VLLKGALAPSVLLAGQIPEPFRPLLQSIVAVGIRELHENAMTPWIKVAADKSRVVSTPTFTSIPSIF
jgi:hypothetical protein